MPWAKIMTRPGSRIMSSLMCMLSHAMTMTACLLAIRRHTYCSYCLRFIWRVSSVKRPGGHLRSCALDMSSSTMYSGQPDSASARWITDCSTKSGVDIIPPQRVTRALGRVAAQDDTSLSCMRSVTVLAAPPLVLALPGDAAAATASSAWLLGVLRPATSLFTDVTATFCVVDSWLNCDMKGGRWCCGFSELEAGDAVIPHQVFQNADFSSLFRQLIFAVSQITLHFRHLG